MQKKKVLAEGSISADQYAQQNEVVAGAKLRGDPSTSIYERVATEPSISVVNMVSGQIGGGNSIQDKAEATIGIRITPGQNPNRVAACVIKHLKAQQVDCPFEVVQKESAFAWKGSLAGPFATRYMSSMAKHFPNTCAEPCGGALPLLKLFQHHVPGMEMVVPGVEDPATAAHSHNESQDVLLFRRAIDSLLTFLQS